VARLQRVARIGREPEDVSRLSTSGVGMMVWVARGVELIGSRLGVDKVVTGLVMSRVTGVFVDAGVLSSLVDDADQEVGG